MNKKTIDLLLLLLIFIIIILLFINNNILTTSVINTSLLFIYKVFPFLFTMIVFNNILVKINLPYYLSKITKSNYLYIFIMSLISGCPINAFLIKDFLDNKYIDEKDASIILAFTNFNNPLFLYYFFKLLFNNNLIIIKLFAIIYLSNIIIMLYFRKKISTKKYLIKYKKYNIQNIIVESIVSSINSLIKIFAIILFFKTLSDVLLPSNGEISMLIKGLIEVTQGLNNLSMLNISIKLKEIIALVIIIFSGFSIHIQISDILKGYNINYKYFYLAKIIMIIFAIFILLLL